MISWVLAVVCVNQQCIWSISSFFVRNENGTGGSSPSCRSMPVKSIVDIRNRGGVSLRPGDGIIHSWLNRMLLPDTVGTGGDSHTRFPIGVSFPAGSGLVAFAAATGVMPLDMPESVLVRFSGTMQPGITLRDLVHAIPYAAKHTTPPLLTVEKQGKINVFSGRVLEIEGVSHLKCEQVRGSAWRWWRLRAIGGRHL